MFISGALILSPPLRCPVCLCVMAHARLGVPWTSGTPLRTLAAATCLAGVQEVHGTFKRIKPSEMQHTPRHMTFRANPNTSSYASDAAEGAGNLGSAYHKGSKGEGGADDEWSRPVTDAEHVWRVGKLLQEAVGRVAQ